MAERFGLIAEPDRVREIEGFYGVASTLIRDELLKLNAEDFSELNIMATQKKINVIIKNMNKFVVKWSRKSIVGTYKDGMATSRVSLRILGATKDPFFDRNIHMNTVDRDEIETIETYIKANNSIKQNVETYFYLLRQAHNDIMQIQAFDLRDEEVIAGLLDDTIKAGGSRGDLQRLIRIHFKRDIFEKKFINISGKNYDMIKYAKMVARTRLRTVQSDAVKNMAAQFDNDLIEISSHGTDDDICREFEGNTYSLSGNTPGYPQMPPNGWPPYHPNCEHFASPTSVGAIEVRGRRND